ncbi:MAG: hypothetical protein DME08_00625 [Candidatus Rokuibacteriota bacterium]|nr:MAG: hypothetical protein DME08_00625 [Candidatus Rokubacteria bacterium]PYN85377.1 MAG: hypothetical protein DMD89_38285 [Candidatus Rokubacteria bacterium]
MLFSFRDRGRDTASGARLVATANICKPTSGGRSITLSPTARSAAMPMTCTSTAAVAITSITWSAQRPTKMPSARRPTRRTSAVRARKR